MDFKSGPSFSEDISFYLVPDPDNGPSVSSWIASTYAFTDAISFCEISMAEMMTFREMTVSESHSSGNSAIFCYALGIESGKCGFLTVLLLELEIKHKHGGFNINYEKATVVWQQFGFGS
jgi:hypothetical protein